MRVTEQVRRNYDRRPYPSGDQSALKDRTWRLAPMEWINAMGLTRIQRDSPGRILVAGCGAGTEAFNLRRRYPRAEIVGIDFSRRSIAVAQALQNRAKFAHPVQFFTADLTSRRLLLSVGKPFDFISCHGVLSYIPNPERVLHNLAHVLKPDGVLYLGVNGVGHISTALRTVLPEFGFEVAEYNDGARLRSMFKFFDAVLRLPSRIRIAQQKPEYLAGDVFGPLIQNYPLAKWVKAGRATGLHLLGSFSSLLTLRSIKDQSLFGLLIPRSRVEVGKLLERLMPSTFHRLLFSKKPEVRPPWAQETNWLQWRIGFTQLYVHRFPERGMDWQRRRAASMKSSALHILLDWKMPEWEMEILRKSKGRQSIKDILHRMPMRPSIDDLRQNLYLLYQLAVINLLPPAESNQCLI